MSDTNDRLTLEASIEAAEAEGCEEGIVEQLEARLANLEWLLPRHAVADYSHNMLASASALGGRTMDLTDAEIVELTRRVDRIERLLALAHSENLGAGWTYNPAIRRVLYEIAKERADATSIA